MRAKDIKPYGNWVLIRVDDRKVQIGMIHLPSEMTGIEAIGSRTGHVVAVGPGRLEHRSSGDKPKIDLFGLQEMLLPGARVVFRDYIRDANPVDVEDDGEYALLHVMDLYGTCGEEVEIGEWSAITSKSRDTSEGSWGRSQPST